jgi:hypothetical protein
VVSAADVLVDRGDHRGRSRDTPLIFGTHHSAGSDRPAMTAPQIPDSPGNTNPITGMTFLFSSGNIASGFIEIYGRL